MNGQGTRSLGQNFGVQVRPQWLDGNLRKMIVQHAVTGGAGRNQQRLTQRLPYGAGGAGLDPEVREALATLGSTVVQP